MSTAMRAARMANGAASRMIAMAAFMGSGYAIPRACHPAHSVRTVAVVSIRRHARTSASGNASVIALPGKARRRAGIGISRRAVVGSPAPRRRRHGHCPTHSRSGRAVRDELCNVVLTVNRRSKTGRCRSAGIAAGKSMVRPELRRRRHRGPMRRSSSQPSTMPRCSRSITSSISSDSNRVTLLRICRRRLRSFRKHRFRS